MLSNILDCMLRKWHVIIHASMHANAYVLDCHMQCHPRAVHVSGSGSSLAARCCLLKNIHVHRTCLNFLSLWFIPNILLNSQLHIFLDNHYIWPRIANFAHTINYNPLPPPSRPYTTLYTQAYASLPLTAIEWVGPAILSQQTIKHVQVPCG